MDVPISVQCSAHVVQAVNLVSSEMEVKAPSNRVEVIIYAFADEGFVNRTSAPQFSESYLNSFVLLLFNFIAC